MFVVGVISVSENKTIILLYVIYHVHPYNWRWNFSSKVITSNDTFFFPLFLSFFLSFLSFFLFFSFITCNHRIGEISKWPQRRYFILWYKHVSAYFRLIGYKNKEAPLFLLVLDIYIGNLYRRTIEIFDSFKIFETKGLKPYLTHGLNYETNNRLECAPFIAAAHRHAILIHANIIF